MDWEAITEFFGGRWGDSAVRLVRIAGILLGAWLLSRLLSRLSRTLRLRIVGHLTAPEQVKRAETLGSVFRYAATVVITLVTGVLVLAELGFEIAPILGAAGVVGLAIGFGAQNLVKDYFSGLFLLLENQMATGDVVTVAGLSGTVEEITLRHVRLRDGHGHVHYISNGLITTVTNKTQGFAYAVMDVVVAYRQQVDEVLEVMREVGAGLAADADFAPRILEPLEVIGVESLGDASVVLRCRFKVPGPEQWAVRREYLRRLKAEFDRKGIETPPPRAVASAPAR
jgi:small-conductance mechanosensitive channel